MIITNSQKLAINSLRKKAFLIAEAGYEAIDIEKAVNRKIKLRNNRLEIFCFGGRMKINLFDFNRVFIIGIGKGSAIASISLVKILGKKLTKGIVLDSQIPKLKIENSKLKILIGTHPLPSKQNVIATQEIIKLVKSANKDDLIISFICGGGSALLCGSDKELKNSVIATKELTKAGANILELNTVRKHLSEVKGGGLAKLVYPATMISLIVSDVLGNNLSMVASGPTVFDKTTKNDAEKILTKYKIQNTKYKIQTRETPKDKKCFKAIENLLFISNQDAILAMVEKTKKIKIKPKIYSLEIKGEAKNIFVPIIKKIKKGEIFLGAGETIVKLKSQKIGKGGRNTEAVLAAINPNLLILSLASDGRDNTEAAGAIGDALTLIKAKKMNLNPKKFLDDHDSFNFFKKTGDLIFTEQKTFNVADLMIILRK